jgi:hypothetical protein
MQRQFLQLESQFRPTRLAVAATSCPRRRRRRDQPLVRNLVPAWGTGRRPHDDLAPRVVMRSRKPANHRAEVIVSIAPAR